MQELEGRVAVVTGGAGGIGEGLARGCAAAGMKVVVADIDARGADAVARSLRESGAEALGVGCDVASRKSVDALADATYQAFGAAHLLCNNAGVLAQAPIASSSDEDWNWLLGVNLFGVIHGVRAFVPRMREQGGEAHIVNTASIAGITPLPALGIYSATKHAVVALSEVLAQELEPDGIGVSILCPGGVDTRIQDAARNRPDAFGGPSTGPPRPSVAEDATRSDFEAALSEVIQPSEVARLVLEAVRKRDLYVFTHPAWKAPFMARADAIFEAYDLAADRRS